jgi:hypothetical protein
MRARTGCQRQRWYPNGWVCSSRSVGETGVHGDGHNHGKSLKTAVRVVKPLIVESAGAMSFT